MPRRLRPKTFRHNPQEHPRLRKRWKRWLPDMRRDMSEILSKQEIFWDLQEVAKENRKILNPGDFFDWMCHNYIGSITISVRSFIDHTKNSRSLWRMLYEILENPGVISRESHARMYASSPFGIDFGRQCFNNALGGDFRFLPQRAIRSDIRKLEITSERIRRFANKRVAHRTKRSELRRLPKFHELDLAIDNLDKTLCKYNFLLTGQGEQTFHATRQYDWREVLRAPWIPEGSKLHPDT